MSEAANPFPGLRPFRTEEHHLFFGREGQTAALLALLRQHRFLAVVGTSGSGKSSLVRAGLIPALHRGTMARAGTSWEVVVLRPGGNPIASLARALLEADLYDPDDPEALPRLRATLTRSLFGLVEAVRQSKALEPETNLLVVVDQFEELFRFRQQGSESEETASAFVSALLTAAQAQDRRIYVVITMRSDYLGDCAQIAGLAEAVNRGEYLIPRLTRDQRRDAIEKPVGVGCARIAPRLVQHMLNDLGDDPDQLPVLQHALMRTWEAWRAEGPDRGPLDLSHYEATGGVASALSRHADEVFAALPDEGHRAAAERLFKALTVKGADNRGIRRPTRLANLTAIVGTGEEAAKSVVEAYRQPGVTFLMPGAGSDLGPEVVIDLSHESLMRVWRRLSAWVEEEAQSARVYRRLAETAALWQKGEAGLYYDPDLQITRTWRDQTKPNAAWAEQYGGGFELAMEFLDRSRNAADAAERTREEARRRQLEQARMLAEAERRQLQIQRLAAKRLRVFAAGLAVVAALAVGAFVVAVKARQEAVSNANLARENEAAATEAAGRAERSAGELKRTLVASDFVQGVEAIERGEGADGLAYLARALRTDDGFWPAGLRAMSTLASGRFPFQTFDAIEQERVITMHWLDEKEDLLLTSDVSAEVEKPQRFVWDARTGKRLYEVFNGKKLSGDLNFTEDGKLLVGYLQEEKTINVREARTGKEACPPIVTEGIGALRLGQHPVEGPLILARHLDGSLQAWKASTGQALTGRLKRTGPASDGFGFSPGARRVYGILGDATIAFWDAVTGTPAGEISTRPYRATERQNQQGGLYFTPDGETVLARADDGKHVNWWRPDQQGPGAAWLEFEDPVEVVFLPGARKAAFVSWASSAPLRVRVHDLDTRAETARIETPRPVGTVFLLSDPALDTLRFPLIAAVEDNLTRIWDLESGRVIREIFAPGLLNLATVSPEGRRVLTLSTGGEIMIWDLFSGEPLLGEPLKHEDVGALAFSPDGEKLITFDSQKLLVQVWDSRTGRRLAEPIQESNIVDLRFPAEGRRLLLWQHTSTSSGNFIKQTTGRFSLFDLSLRPVLFEPLLDAAGGGATGSWAKAAFTPDGRELVVCGKPKPGDPHGLLVFDAASRSLRRTLSFPQGSSAHELSLSPDGRQAAVASNDDRVRVFDLNEGKLVHQLALDGNASSISISADGSRIVIGMVRGKVQVWDLRSGTPLFAPLDHGDKSIPGVAFSPDGTLFASCSQDFKFRLADARTGQARFEPLTFDNVVQTAAFSPDGAYVAPVPFSGELPLVEVSTGKIVRRLRHNDACRTVKFSPDGTILAVTTGGDFNKPIGEVFLWNWRDGRTVSRPLKSRGSVNTLEFSRDGSLLATGTLLPGRGAVQVWDVASGLPVTDPVLGRSQITAVAFHPQGVEVAAAWQDGTVRVIDLPPRSLPQPVWLPRLVEAVAGRRMVAGAGGVERVAGDELGRARADLPAAAGAQEGTSARWADWFFSESGDRTISPGSKMTFREYLARLRRSTRIEDLQEALKLEPADGLTHARLGLVLLDNLASQGDLDRQKEVSERLRRHWEDTAAWYGRRAVELEPKNSEAWALRAEILQRLGRNDEAGAAATKAVEIDPSREEASSPNGWYLKALALAGERKWTEAEKALATALEAVSSGAGDRQKAGAVPLLGALAALEPTRPPAGFREIRLPEPIPGTFEDFDSVQEGGVPAGWTASHEPTDAPRAPEESGRLDTPRSEVFEDWIAVSRDRATRSSGTQYYSQRTLTDRRLERVNGSFIRRLLHGRFLYSLSGERNSSHVHYLSTPDYDCSNRSGVQVAFHSVYEQSPTTVAGLEYSIDGGRSWLPVFYRLNALQAVQDASGKIDAKATLEKAQDYPALFIDAGGRPRGSAYGDFVGAPLGRDLDPHLQGLKAFNSPETNRVEVFRLARADGQPKVRLRFLHAGRFGWYWAIDDFGLYQMPEGGLAAAPEVVDRTRDPGFLGRLSLATLLGKDPNADDASDPDALFDAAAKLPQDLPALRAGGADPASGTSGEERNRLRRTLAARILGLRALALAPEDRDLLVWGALTALETGDLNDAEALARKALGKGPTPQLIPTFRNLFLQKGVKLEKAGDEKAAGVCYEMAHVLSLAATQSGDRKVLERLAAAGLAAASEILVPRGSEWRYLDDGTDPGPLWKDPDFDDRLWPSGKARLGFGEDGEQTPVSSGPTQEQKNITFWFRATFEVKATSSYQQLRLSVQRDDGVVVYLNGQEIARDNLPEGEIGPKTLAPRTMNGEEEKRWLVFEVPAAGLRAGRNVIAAEVHQQAASSSDLGFDLELEGTGGLKETERASGELEAIEERIGVPPELRTVLWTSRAERYLRAGSLERASEAVERAARSGPGNPAVDYQRALLLQARDQDDAAYQSYRKAAEAAIDLKAAPGSAYGMLLPESLKGAVEPLVKATGLGVAAAAGRMARTVPASREIETRWLLRWSEELDWKSPEARRQRAEALFAFGKTQEALAAADAALADPESRRPGAPPHLFRERKEWLGLRERCLRREKKSAEADAVREEIFQRPPRDPALGPKHLDLSAHYNAGIYDGRDWHGEVSLSTLPESFRPRDGVRFDIRGMIQLNSGVIPGYGKDLNGIGSRNYPYQVTGIPVGLKAGALHFLLSACYDQAAEGVEVGRFVVRYEDGLEAPVPIKQVEDVADWAVGPILKLNPDRLAWVGGRPQLRMVERKTWKNPHPDKTIREIDFVSAKAAAAPYLIAVTAE